MRENYENERKIIVSPMLPKTHAIVYNIKIK